MTTVHLITPIITPDLRNLDDLGLKPARKVVKIPVVGPREASMPLAAMLEQRPSIVTILDSVKPIVATLR